MKEIRRVVSMFVDLLRDVTNIEVRIPQITRSPTDLPASSAPSSDNTFAGTVSLFPLQSILIQITATLRVDVGEVAQNPTMRHLAMECGESDPLTAWSQLLSRLHVTPVLATKTAASAASCNNNLRVSSTLGRLGGGGGYADASFVLESYPPATTSNISHNKACSIAASPARRRRSTIARLPDAGLELESYVSLAWPENPVAESSRPPLRTSFSPPGGALARNPGASFFHACQSLMLEGARDGFPTPAAQRSSSPAAGAAPSLTTVTATTTGEQPSKQQPQFTFTLPMTIPNVADGSGCIAIRLNLSPSQSSRENSAVAATSSMATASQRGTLVASADVYDVLLDYDTIDAPMTHLDTPLASQAASDSPLAGSTGGTLGRAASVDNSATVGGAASSSYNDPLFLGTVVQPIRVRGALECETQSRLVAPNRAHILVSITNVSSMSTQIHGVEFDLLSTRLGQFKDSLDYAANKSPDYRTAPKAFEDNLVAMLTRSIAVVPLASDESRPYLQPRETYCFQFVLQLRPHLAHLLTAAAPAAATSGSTPSSNLNRATNSTAAVETKPDVMARNNNASLMDPASGCGFSGPLAAGQYLKELLEETFVTAVHVQFRADAVALGGEQLFRSELTVPWTLS